MISKAKEFIESGISSDGHPPVSLIQSGVITKAGDFEYSSMTTVFLNQPFDVNKVKQTFASVQSIQSQVSILVKNGGPMQCVVAVEASLWTNWNTKVPQEMKPFIEKKSKIYPDIGFPATGGDLFFYTKAQRLDLCFEAAKIFVAALGVQNVQKVEQTNGFKYLDGKDLTGFVDGTRNSSQSYVILDTAVIHTDDDEAIDHVGGSYLLVSRFVHDLQKFQSFNENEKSSLIGRHYSKVESNSNPRLPDAYSHLNKIGDYPLSQSSNYHINRGYGVMFRQAWPYGTVSENGLLFLAFSRSLKELDTALNRMIGVGTKDESQIDNLWKITRAVSTNYYYCPSVKQLSFLAKPMVSMDSTVEEKK